MSFDVRPVQTKVKHIILKQYAGAWAGIIAHGVRRDLISAVEQGRDVCLDLVYVDGFGGEGRYGRDFDGSSGPAWGSPVIGTQALEAQAAKFTSAGLPVRVTAVIVEYDHARYARLIENLRAAGLSTPVLAATQLTRASYGHVTVLRGDFRDHLGGIMSWLGSGTKRGDAFALFLVDPFGPTMPMADVHTILRRPRTDAVVLFPYYDLEVRSGSAAKADDERRPMDRQNVAVRTAHFGTDRYVEITRRPGLTAAERERAYAGLYEEQLRAADSSLIVKNIPLRLGEIARTAYHLWLVTRNADGAMKMNEVLRSAEVEEDWIRWQGQEAREQAAQAASEQGSLELGLPCVPPPLTEKRAFPPEEVAAALLRRLTGRTLTLGAIYAALADTLHTPGEIRKGLRALRDRGEADYDALTKATALVRLGRPAVQLAPPATRPRAAPEARA